MAGLLDFLQGASNAAASNISGPVDLLGMGLRGIGVPVPQNAFLGSQWMQDKGLTRKPENYYAGLLGEAAGNVLPIVAAAKAPQIARGLLQAGDNLRAPTPMNSATRGQAGAIVYHGSPHKFDKFDSSKIGTGEGAQAYGHGLYLADSPDVARSYRQELAGVELNFADEAARKSANQMMPFGFGDPVSVLKNALGFDGDVTKAVKTLRTQFGKYPERAAHAAHLADLLESGAVKPVPGGALYKVDLPDEQIAKMLDWDKPLSQQSEAVKKSVDALVAKHAAQREFESLYGLNMTGGDFYRDLMNGAKRLPNTQLAAEFRDSGIPGIRYLDGGSRTAGAGSSNYVVFPGNEGLLKILGRE
jgi:hypothetical protein